MSFDNVAWIPFDNVAITSFEKVALMPFDNVAWMSFDNVAFMSFDNVAWMLFDNVDSRISQMRPVLHRNNPLNPKQARTDGHSQGDQIGRIFA
jgi:hypothetical protein